MSDNALITTSYGTYTAETAWPMNEDPRAARVLPPARDAVKLLDDTGSGTLVLLVMKDISATDLRTSSVSRIPALISLAGLLLDRSHD